MALSIKQRITDFLSHTKHLDPFDIQLFPLDTVLFPGGMLVLKVFEPRYIEMVSSCLKNNLVFGACLIHHGEETPAQPKKIGCLVEITDWDMLQVGILNIQVVGLRRFHIENTRVETNGLIGASVIQIADEISQPLPIKYQACASLLQRLIEHLGSERFNPPLLYDDAVWVGYRLAELLPLKRSARQNMLEMNDSQVRIEILHKFMALHGLLT